MGPMEMARTPSDGLRKPAACSNAKKLVTVLELVKVAASGGGPEKRAAILAMESGGMMVRYASAMVTRAPCRASDSGMMSRATAARLSLQGGFLVMEMDVVVAAGVSADHLRSHLELWDRLLQEFIVYLREYSQNAARLQTPAEPTEAPLEEAVAS
jgi:hypothetical protein